MELRKNKPLRSFGFFPKRPLGSLKDKVKGAWNRRAEKRALHLEKKGKTHAEGAKDTSRRALALIVTFSNSEVRKICQFWLLTFWLLTVPSPSI